jgi:hypothetical protein
MAMRTGVDRVGTVMSDSSIQTTPCTRVIDVVTSAFIHRWTSIGTTANFQVFAAHITEHRMTVTRISSIVFLALALLASPGVTAQTSPTADVGPSAFAGVWEGFNSDGVWLYWVFRNDESTPGVIELSSTMRSPEGELTTSSLRFRIEQVNPDLVRLAATSGDTSIVVNFYSTEGMRLTWPSGQQAVLARSLAELPDFPPPSALQMRFTVPIQSRILSLAGDWYAQSPEESLGGSFRITVVDPGAGTLVVRESAGTETHLSSAPARAAHIAPHGDDQFKLTYDETGDEQMVIWRSESGISLVGADGVVVELGRRPPE